MALRDDLYKKHVYLDANIFIDILNGCDSELTSVYSDLQDLMDEKAFRITCSKLIYAEVLPYSDGKWDINELKNVTEFLDSFHTVPISNKIIMDSGVWRGETGMKVPDTFHVMTAVDLKCDIFLTNDNGITVPDNSIKIIYLSDHKNKPTLKQVMEEQKLKKIATIKARDNNGLSQRKNKLAQLKQERKDNSRQQRILSSEIKDIEELEAEEIEEELKKEELEEEIKNRFNS